MSKKVPLVEAGASRTRPVFAHVLKLSCFLFVISLQVYGQAELIKDIDVREEILENEYDGLTAASTHVYFANVNELWRSGGTPNTTLHLKTFNGTIDKSTFTTIGNMLYFTASDGESGMELWKSNGSVTGTVRVKDIYPGSSSGYPKELTNVNGIVYFVAEDGKTGRELWKSNGTASGTVLVKDIFAKGGASNPKELTDLNGNVYFSANDGNRGYELWKTDGTAAGTVLVKDIRPASRVSSAPASITASNGRVFFSATDDTHGKELWRSDGTEAGTVMVKDIRASGLSDVDNLTDVNGTLFFTANNGVNGDELWKSDGTDAGTVMVKDMNPGGGGSNNTSPFGEHMNNFRSINGKLFFIAAQGGNDYIYRSDGTEEGTIRISRAFAVAMQDAQPMFTGMGDHVYYFNIDIVPAGDYEQQNGLFLWKLSADGTTPEKVKRFFMPTDYSESYYYENYDHAMVHCNNRLYIIGRLADHQGFKLIRSDGTASGTQVIADPYTPTLGSNPSDMIAVNDVVFFRTRPDPYEYIWANPEDNSSEQLYRTDGTAEGTYALQGAFQDWNEMAKVGERLYYTVEHGGGWELNHTSDGRTVTNVTLDSHGETRPVLLTAVGDHMYYTNGYGELWRTKGVTEDQVRVRDLHKILSITDVNGLAYVLAETSAGGLEVWRTNATGSLLKVKTVRAGTAAPSTRVLTAADRNTFYFTANDGVHGNELWKSEGTEATTGMIRDLNFNDPRDRWGVENDIDGMVVANGHVFVSCIDYFGNQALFSYEYGGRSYHWYYTHNQPKNLKSFNGKVYYTSGNWLYATGGPHELLFLGDLGRSFDRADYAELNNELYVSIGQQSDYIWKTNGTECGTIPIAVGIGNAFPIEASGNDMIMGAGGFGYFYGGEPYIYRNITDIQSPCAFESMNAFAANEETVLTPYPNPFIAEFTLRISGNENEVADVGVFTSSGFPVERFEDVKANTEYPNIGSQWPKGMYVVKVSKGGVVTTHTVVKK